MPVLATASGQRKFVLKDEIEELDQDLEKSDCSVALGKMGFCEETLTEKEDDKISSIVGHVIKRDKVW